MGAFDQLVREKNSSEFWRGTFGPATSSDPVRGRMSLRSRLSSFGQSRNSKSLRALPTLSSMRLPRSLRKHWLNAFRWTLPSPVGIFPQTFKNSLTVKTQSKDPRSGRSGRSVSKHLPQLIVALAYGECGPTVQGFQD
jgi:hypothetical protein